MKQARSSDRPDFFTIPQKGDFLSEKSPEISIMFATDHTAFQSLV